MAAGKKFGTVAGVFTPSLLTILGVIMYLRLGWVVGEAGLIGSILIILIAHLISISTGLSVSSIATDKKVKAGGIYYILSRSLGLPIGGAIGITLFVGTAFSIALYVIGFSESFNDFIGIGVSANELRLTGSIVLLALTVIAFISTSLALKTQFFILAAIALSLASIFSGSGGGSAVPSAVSSESGVSLEVVFAVFFPAVTGFTAGVALSGDLKDPNRSIPVGTMASIAVGLIVYLSLAIYLAYAVDPETLKSDYNILLKIALFAPLVVAGIWGATLSSALGGILGAPRILQALSVDRITPRFLGQGIGKENEPRNALIATFLIAEMGILIGELDMIARLVSMFYLTAYGFINLACALETWASSDFRPQFRIPKTIGIVGFAATFTVMFRIDFLAMIGAFLVIGGVFLYLTRREIKLGFGDVWQGVWASIVRAGLGRLQNEELHERNWRPNIILFTTGNSVRSSLMSLGVSLVGKLGILSNFELTLDRSSEDLLSRKRMLEIDGELPPAGITARQQDCRDLYEGMSVIARTHGLSGVEPNTVMLEWDTLAAEPKPFAKLVKTFIDSDFNLVFTKVNAQRGFGDRKRIDVWWRGTGNNGKFTLTLIRFLQLSEEWKGVRLRILIAHDGQASADTIYRNVSNVLREWRLEANIKIINNANEHRSSAEMIRAESGETDMVILGMPPPGDGQDFVAKTELLLNEVGTVLLVKASNYFDDLHLGMAPAPSQDESIVPLDSSVTEKPLPEIEFPGDEIRRETAILLEKDLRTLLDDFYKSHFEPIEAGYREWLEEIRTIFIKNIEALQRIDDQPNSLRNQRLAAKLQNDFLFHARQLVTDFQEVGAARQSKALQDSVHWLNSTSRAFAASLREELIVFFDPDELNPETGDTGYVRRFKFRKRLAAKLFRRTASDTVRLRQLVTLHLKAQAMPLWANWFRSFAVKSGKFISDTSHLLERLNGIFDLIKKTTTQDRFDATLPSREKESGLKRLDEADDKLQNHFATLLWDLHQTRIQLTQNLIDSLLRLDQPKAVKKLKKDSKRAREAPEVVSELPELWNSRQHLSVNFMLLDLHLLSFEKRFESIEQKLKIQLSRTIDSNVLKNLTNLSQELAAAPEKFRKTGSVKFKPLTDFKRSSYDGIIDGFFEEIREIILELPDAIEILSEPPADPPTPADFEELDTLSISVRRLVEYLIEADFIEPLQKDAAKLPTILQETFAATDDVVRLISFSASHSENQEQAADPFFVDTLTTLVRESQDRVKAEILKVEEMRKNLVELIDRLFQEVAGKLRPYAMKRYAENLKRYVRKQESKKVFSRLEQQGLQIREKARTILTRLWYRKSESVLTARRLGLEAGVESTPVETLLNFVDDVSPDPGVFRTLPFYYKQLFLGKQTVGREFWIGRKRELERADVAVTRYQRGYLGGLMVVGEPDSGKTHLCRTIAARYFDRHKTFFVRPPDGGSIDDTLFSSALAKAFDLTGSHVDMFEQLPRKSVVILDDLEQWWERSENGMKIVETVLDLIDRYSQKCFFVVNTNSFAFSFINTVRPIDKFFLDVVDCGPFNAEEIQQAVLRRHRSSGLKFELHGHGEDSLSEWKLARQFTRFFDYSGGNIGIVLRSWLACVSDFQQNTVTITDPKTGVGAGLRKIDADWAVQLVQFALHKQLTPMRLSRINREPEDKVMTDIISLKRAGLISEDLNRVLQMNSYARPHLIQQLKEMELI